MYYTYIIRCKDNSLYTGITTDIERRWEEHKSRNDKCAKYTKTHPVLKIESVWESETRVQASKLEYNIKTLKREQKEELIKTKKLEKFFKEKFDCNCFNEKQIMLK